MGDGMLSVVAGIAHPVTMTRSAALLLMPDKLAGTKVPSCEFTTKTDAFPAVIAMVVIRFRQRGNQEMNKTESNPPEDTVAL